MYAIRTRVQALFSTIFMPKPNQPSTSHTGREGILTIDFVRAFTFPHECAYAPGHYGDLAFVVSENVPGDAGGITKWGIDQSSHPDINIANLSQADAESIYLSEYQAILWEDRTAALDSFPYPASYAFFDCREVCGLTAAWKCLQRALALDPDGISGPLTKAATVKAPASTLTSTMIDEREAYHRLIAHRNPEDAQFLQGWLNRCSDLRNFLYGH